MTLQGSRAGDAKTPGHTGGPAAEPKRPPHAGSRFRRVADMAWAVIGAIVLTLIFYEIDKLPGSSEYQPTPSTASAAR